jgi:hypothetical protein
MQAAYRLPVVRPNFLHLNEKPGEAPSGLTQSISALCTRGTVARCISIRNKNKARLKPGWSSHRAAILNTTSSICALRGTCNRDNPGFGIRILSHNKKNPKKRVNRVFLTIGQKTPGVLESMVRVRYCCGESNSVIGRSLHNWSATGVECLKSAAKLR